MKISRLITVLAFSIGIFGWSFFALSCQDNGPKQRSSPDAPQVDTEKKNIKDSAVTIGEVAKSVGEKADSLENHANSIELKSTPESLKLVRGDVDGIKTDAVGLRKDKSTLDATEQKLKDTEASLSVQQERIKDFTKFAAQSESDRTKLQEKIKNLESSNGKLVKTMLSWIISACVVGIGICLVVGFVFKTPSAFMIAAGCLATMGVAIGVTFYMQQIAWIAIAVLGLCFVIAVIYVFIQVKNKDKAVTELFHTGEVVKSYLPTNAKEKIFGSEVEPGIAHQIQSKTTKDLVSKIKRLTKERRGFGLFSSLKKENNSLTIPTNKTVNESISILPKSNEELTTEIPSVDLITPVFTEETSTQKTILG